VTRCPTGSAPRPRSAARSSDAAGTPRAPGSAKICAKGVSYTRGVSSDESRSLVSRLAHVLASGPPVRLALLFGSASRGALRQTSDLDIGVIFHEPAPSLGQELALAADLSRATGREIDLVRLDSASTLVRWEVARSAVLIHASPRSTWSNFIAQAALEHADMAPLLEPSARTYATRVAQTGAK
jgi:predicted nucleotidyltransferase